jgi:hypothetical protein
MNGMFCMAHRAATGPTKDPKQNQTTRRNWLRPTSLAVAAGSIALVFAAPMAAQASSFNSVMTASTPLRICANTSSTCNNPQGLSVISGEHVQMRCWEDSQWYDGTNRWFIVMAPNADMGWVSADMVAAQTQTKVGHC